MGFNFGDWAATAATGGLYGIGKASVDKGAKDKRIFEEQQAEAMKQKPVWDTQSDLNSLAPMSTYGAADYGKSLSGINADKSALEAGRREALRSGPGAAAGYQMNKLSSATAMQESDARAKAAQDTLASQNALSMRGGLSSGARERIAALGNKARMDATQRANALGNQGMMDILSKDEINRLNSLQSQTGNELEYSKFDMSKAAEAQRAKEKELSDTNQWNMNKWNQRLATNAAKYKDEAAMFGAARTADAQRYAAQNTGGLGGRGGFLGLGF